MIPDTAPLPTFGAQLKHLRKHRDLTQAELAQIVGCARISIRKFESDDMRPSKQLAELLAQALGIPAAERAAFVRLARGLASPDVRQAANAPATPPPNNLPLQPTSFIGRERELAELNRLFVGWSDSPVVKSFSGDDDATTRPHDHSTIRPLDHLTTRPPDHTTTRLITLVGPGGTGKTRLSLKVAAAQLAAFRDGVWFVELAPIADPALVTDTVATVLGVQAEESRPLLTTLLDWLRDKQLLLILDNCEHLIEACARFADAVIRSSTGTRILASSREALGIAGELTYPVPSLASPELAPDEPLPLAQLEQYAAVRLFVERASFIRPSFKLTAANAHAVIQICRRLDGIPLAIELAAARINALRVEQIAERLDDRFRLLTGGSRTAVPRQQTLRGTLDWSYSLLSDSERALLRRLAIFSVGWTLEAAEAVCAGESIKAPDVLNLLTRLVAKSLAVLDDEADESRRLRFGDIPKYRMLDSIRQYALEKLLDARESERLRDRHLAFFVEFAQTTEPHLQEADRAVWLARLEADYDNLRAALEWACERNAHSARYLAGLLGRFWFHRDTLSDGPAWYRRVLALPQAATPERGTALSLLGAGLLASLRYFLDKGGQFIAQSVALWQELDDQPRLAEATFWLAWQMTQVGQPAEACAIFEANEVLLRQHAHPAIRACALSYWGSALENARSDHAQAKRLLAESLELAVQLNDAWALSTVLANLGHAAAARADYETATAYYLEELTWRRQVGARRGIATALGHVSAAARLHGDSAQAKACCSEALDIYRAVGFQLHVAHFLNGLGYIALRQGDPAQAAAHFAESLSIYRERADPYGTANGLAGYAELWRIRGRPATAVTLLAYALIVHSLQWGVLSDGRIEHERSTAAARAQLDETAFNAAWEAGLQLTLPQAIALAQDSD